MLELVLVALLLCLTLVTWSILYACRRAGQPWAAIRTAPPCALGTAGCVPGPGLAGGPDVGRHWPLWASNATDQLDEARLPADVDLQAASILAQALVSLAVVAISISAIRVRYRAASTDLGWSAAKIGSDIRLGVVAFLALAPPVYALQICLVQWFESKHPLIELIRQNPQPRLIAVCIVSAVLVAPVIEEYLFRGLLQGWLERLADGRDNSLDVVLGGPARQPTSASTDVLSKRGQANPAAGRPTRTRRTLTWQPRTWQTISGTMPAITSWKTRLLRTGRLPSALLRLRYCTCRMGPTGFRCSFWRSAWVISIGKHIACCRSSSSIFCSTPVP